MTAKELERLRSSAQRGQPYGNESWQVRIAKRLGLESTLRTRGRPTEEQNMKIGLIPFSLLPFSLLIPFSLLSILRHLS
jgi:hypothetical protein